MTDIGALLRKLGRFAQLTGEEKQALAASARQFRQCNAHEDVVREGEPCTSIHMLLSGFACCQKSLPDGRRQIIGFLLPGDMFDQRSLLQQQLGHTISTLTPARIAVIARETLLELTERYPRLTRALWWAALLEESIAREWLLNLGQKTAIERLAHLFCELLLRLRAAGVASGNSCELPLTQADLADACALSTVHINRTLQELRRQELISVRGKTLIVHNFERLQLIAMFNENYLCLRQPATEPRVATT